MVIIIDYGMGNLKSVYNALKKIECQCMISADIEVIKSADAIILPGVGSFKDCMANLNKAGLVNVIREFVATGKPLLGICLGMQVLFNRGYEVEETEGLGLLDGQVVKMIDESVKIPHIGWNNLEKNNKDNLNEGLNENSFVYYVHSYYVQNYNDDDLVSYSNYGSLKIPGLVRKNNVMGAQFHPEKSGDIGLKILKNFKEAIL